MDEKQYEEIKKELESLSNLFCTALGIDVDTPEKKKIAKNAYVKGGLACITIMKKYVKENQDDDSKKCIECNNVIGSFLTAYPELCHICGCKQHNKTRE